MSQKVKLVGKSVKAYIEWELRDPQGRLVKRARLSMKSWVKQWLQFFWSYLSQTTTSIIDTGGISRTITGTSPFAANAGAGVSAYGIVAGTSDTPVSKDDYKLGSQIAHGNGVGQLMYGAMSFDAPVTYGTGYLTRAVRVFTNSSGDNVTVKEIGLCIVCTNLYFCVIRDVLSSPVTIPNGYSWTVRYNFYFVV